MGWSCDNIWVIGPGGLTDPSHIEILSSLQSNNDHKILYVGSRLRDFIEHTHIQPDIWTWLDPHQTKNVEPDDIDCDIILPHFCIHEKLFPVSSACHSEDPTYNWDDYYLKLSKFSNVTKLPSLYIPSLQHGQHPSFIGTPHTSNEHLATKLTEEPEYRFNGQDRLIIGTSLTPYWGESTYRHRWVQAGYTYSLENILTSVGLPVAHNISGKSSNVHIIGFSGSPSRPYITFDQLTTWINWREHTSMTLHNFSPSINQYLPCIDLQDYIDVI